MTQLVARRVHLLSGPGKRSPRPEAPPAVKPPALGAAWARVTLMRDGRVLVEGKRASIEMDPAHARVVQDTFRNLGVKERP